VHRKNLDFFSTGVSHPFVVSYLGYYKSAISPHCLVALWSQEQVEAGGPREPWHDWHCKIDGPAAYDVLTNFEQRWRKATRRHDDELIQIERISWILGPKHPFPPEGDPKLYVTKDDDPESWHVQVSSQSMGSAFLSKNFRFFFLQGPQIWSYV